MLLLVWKVALTQVKVWYNIENDLIALRDEFKYEIECFVVDWGKAIKKAIEKVFPDAKIQRCLTHIKRWGELRSKRE